VTYFNTECLSAFQRAATIPHSPTSSFCSPLAEPPPLTSATLTARTRWRQVLSKSCAPFAQIVALTRQVLLQAQSGDHSLGSLTSFPIRTRPRTVRHELEVSAQKLRSSPSPCITASLLPSRSQDARSLSPGHWPLRLVLGRWSAAKRAVSCL
jgi:hypothetical protein